MRAVVQSQRSGDVESSSTRIECAMIFQMSQPVETRHGRLSSASMGPLKNLDASPPARKAHTYEIHEKAKGGDGEEEEDGDTAAALPHAVVPVGAPSA
jgi:hypothetical protein